MSPEPDEQDPAVSRMRPLEPPRDFASPLHSQGVLVANPGALAFVSGQVGVRPDGSIGHGVSEQVRIAFENIARVLAEGGLGLGDVASLRIYLTSHDHIVTFADTASRCLGGHRPAATLLVVDRLANPDLLVQVEAVAVGR